MSRKIDPNVLIIDVESSCWSPKESQPSDEISEIIEIGIAVVNTKELIITKNDSIIIKPQRSKISKFCTELTTLTQEYVDQGITFQAAMEILTKDYNSESRTMLSWGAYDKNMFERNCKDYNCKYPFGPNHINLKNLFTMLHGINKEVGMESALDFLSLKLEGTHHRGLWDAKNIAEIFTCSLRKFRNGPVNTDCEY
jgi:inhibitor of KinA sporulation pathway (predicted exonuclease)